MDNVCVSRNQIELWIINFLRARHNSGVSSLRSTQDYVLFSPTNYRILRQNFYLLISYKMPVMNIVHPISHSEREAYVVVFYTLGSLYFLLLFTAIILYHFRYKRAFPFYKSSWVFLASISILSIRK